jgi:hypothetical protein
VPFVLSEASGRKLLKHLCGNGQDADDAIEDHVHGFARCVRTDATFPLDGGVRHGPHRALLHSRSVFEQAHAISSWVAQAVPMRVHRDASAYHVRTPLTSIPLSASAEEAMGPFSPGARASLICQLQLLAPHFLHRMFRASDRKDFSSLWPSASADQSSSVVCPQFSHRARTAV